VRIGLIAPPWIPIPPPAYGGTEVVVDNLARGLKALGHDVVLFTVGESECPVERRWLFERGSEPIGVGSVEVAHALAAYDALRDVDIIHDHTLFGPLIARGAGHHAPIVTTNHGPFTDDAKRIYTAIADEAAIVAISHSQAHTAGDIPIAAVIHHGVDLDAYAMGPGGGSYALFIGRMSPDKGPDRAVRIARQAGLRLVIVTKMREPGERAYYEEVVRPLLDDSDAMPEELPLEERILLMQDARAIVNPIAWPEPFGLVMIESLATGTPVLAFPNGAAPEIVEDGVTGFLCADEDEMVAALGKIDDISRAACRAAAERKFSLERMARDHLELYERVLEGDLRDERHHAHHNNPHPTHPAHHQTRSKP
jgi:glycosyltransferase involved in cell wall biosynthesis